MTKVIRFQHASIEHMVKQPRNLRYALFCDDVIQGTLQDDCDSQKKLGHIDDFIDYPTAKEAAIRHPHRALIKFYPDFDDNRIPSLEFTNDFNNQKIKPNKAS